MKSVDQERARYAWERVQNVEKDYVNLVKGAPALIMTSGLMQVLAFHQEKGKKEKAHRALVTHLCEWLHRRFKTKIASQEFGTVMKALMGSDQGNAAQHAHFYQQATDEVMALLRWLRQFGAAVKGEGNG